MEFRLGELVFHMGRRKVITQIVYVKGKQRVYFEHDGDKMPNAWAHHCRKIS